MGIIWIIQESSSVRIPIVFFSGSEKVIALDDERNVKEDEKIDVF
jgi:hypothetical protein